MEKTGITITKRKDGRYVGKFIAEYADNGKAQYHYVYGKTYEEAESKVLIGREIATRYLSGRYITVSKVYREWLTAFGILLSLFMGLRIGELCGLKWEDVDFQHKVLRIRRTVQRITSANGNRKTKIVISVPKSATSFREIAIPDMLMKYFEMFRDEANHFILSGTDKPVEPRTMQYRYKKILQSAEVESHNYHKLRHTFATNSAEKGFNVKVLSAVLGHSSVTLTLNRYIHPDRTYERRLMNMCMQL